MSVYDLNSTVVCYTDMVGLDPHHLAELLVCLVHGLVPSAMSNLPHKPQVRKLRWKWCRTFRQAGVSDIWQ